MTVYTQIVEYALDGDGVTVAFSYPGRVDDLENLHCAVALESGGVVERDYTVTGDDQGATFTFIAAPAAGERVYMWRDTPPEQRVDYAAGDFPSETHERTADRLVLMAQEVRDSGKRTLRLNRSGPVLNPINPVEFSGKLMGIGPDHQLIPSTQTLDKIDNAASVVDRALAEMGISRGADLDFGLITTAANTIEDWGSIE
ncbi:hypothetical protein [Celeribacter sp.]|uniref:hypothetical protein n=1 Tax=Celeribacter sp. TaxID=1890673 RepID=UPI003A8F4C97